MIDYSLFSRHDLAILQLKTSLELTPQVPNTGTHQTPRSSQPLTPRDILLTQGDTLQISLPPVSIPVTTPSPRSCRPLHHPIIIPTTT